MGQDEKDADGGADGAPEPGRGPGVGAVLSNLVALWAEALRDPRANARRILSWDLSGAQVAMIAILAFALSAFIERLAEVMIGVTLLEARLATEGVELSEDLQSRLESSRSIAGTVQRFIVDIAGVVLLSAIAWRVGSLVEGKGSFGQIFAVSGWFSLASVPIQAFVTLLFLVGSPAVSLIALLVYLAGLLYLYYVYCAFVAEAHGFESVGQVMIAGVGVVFAVSMALVFLAILLGLDTGMG